MPLIVSVALPACSLALRRDRSKLKSCYAAGLAGLEPLRHPRRLALISFVAARAGHAGNRSTGTHAGAATGVRDGSHRPSRNPRFKCRSRREVSSSPVINYRPKAGFERRQNKDGGCREIIAAIPAHSGQSTLAIVARAFTSRGRRARSGSETSWEVEDRGSAAIHSSVRRSRLAVPCEERSRGPCLVPWLWLPRAVGSLPPRGDLRGRQFV